MASFCKITLIGNVGRDPELRVFADGRKVASFSLAINNPMNKDVPPTWYRISVWDKRADAIMNFVKQGTNLFVEGRLDLREYVDQAGIKKISPEVSASDFQLLGSKEGASIGNFTTQITKQASETHESVYNAPAPEGYGKGSINDEDDLPF
jgi:single-strand DNA-binding protein